MGFQRSWRGFRETFAGLNVTLIGWWKRAPKYVPHPPHEYRKIRRKNGFKHQRGGYCGIFGDVCRNKCNISKSRHISSTPRSDMFSLFHRLLWWLATIRYCLGGTSKGGMVLLPCSDEPKRPKGTKKGMVPKMGVPQWLDGLQWKIPIEQMDDWGYPYDSGNFQMSFSKTPFGKVYYLDGLEMCNFLLAIKYGALEKPPIIVDVPISMAHW